MLQPQILSINNLRGFNTKKTLTQLSANEANSALNGYFDTTGSFRERAGFVRVNTTEIDSGYDINSSYQFDDKIILAGGTDLKSYVSGSPSDLTTSLTGSFFDFEEFYFYKTNYLVATNGQDFAFKYDGTTLTKLSISRPTTSPTLTDTTGGTLTAGDYKVSVTFLRDNGSGEIQESNPCNTVSISLAGNRIALSSIPVSPDAQVNGRNVYVTRPNGAILYKATLGANATLADNTTTTYNISTPVDVLINKELEYDHDAAPKCYLTEKYKDRIILAGSPDFPDRVFISKSNDFQGNAGQWYFPQGELDEANKLYFSIGEKVTTVKAYYDLVFIFGENGGVFTLSGNNESNFILSEVTNDDNVTSLSDRAALIQDNWCYFLARDGYYRTNGQIIQKISEPLSAWFDSNNQTLSEYNVDGFGVGLNQIVPVAIYYKKLNQILLWVTQAGQNDYVNNICFVLHLSNVILDGDVVTPNYSIYTNFATRCVCRYSASNSVKYLLTSQSDGFIFEAERGRFDGAAINSTATSATTTTLVDSTQSWTIDTYTGLWVTAWKGTGAGQSRLISSNTGDTLTVTPAWVDTPDGSSQYTIGGIYYQYIHSYNSYGNDSLSKRLIYIRPRFTSDGDATIRLSFGYDFVDLTNNEPDLIEIEISGDSEWDVAQWDVALWDGPVVLDNKQSAKLGRIHRWSTVKILNPFANTRIYYDGLDKIFQIKGVR